MSDSYLSADYPQSHLARRRQILHRHRDVRHLMGPDRSSAVWTVVIVCLSFVAAALAANAAWWIVLVLGYLIGGTLAHAAWVLLHEGSHNLVFRTSRWNKVSAIVANMPLLIPAATTFRHYHLLHHAKLGELEHDADLPRPFEARIVRTPIVKTLWLATLSVIQAMRSVAVLPRAPMDVWVWGNIAVQAAVVAAVAWFGGVRCLAFLAIGLTSSVGLHPLGSRWMHEHHTVAGRQETYSYYGPLNKLCFNMGYHVEHHDFSSIPWSRLPRLRTLAPEFYETLAIHRSWTILSLRFIVERNRTLFQRVVRRS